MTRTHAFLSLAAALTVTAALQPAQRAWARFRAPPLEVASRADSGGLVPLQGLLGSSTRPLEAPSRFGADRGALLLQGALSQTRPLEGAVTYVRYDVRATDARPSSAQQGVQLALLVDRSGSMAGEKLARARAAALSLVELLQEDDEMAVVTFSDDSQVLPLTRADAEGKARMRQFINTVRDAGGTNISDALTQAQQLLNSAPTRGVRRVVLVSDGQPTQGMTREADLVRLSAAMHESQLAVSALGVGYDFNGPLMQHLAERGGGYYAYLNDPEKLTAVLQLELAQARGAVARHVSLKLELSDGAQLLQVAGREVMRNGDEVTVMLPDFAPGQTAQAFVELKVPAGAAALKIAARLEYVDANAGAAVVGKSARLAAETTDQPSVAEASKDVQVAADCIRAVGTTQMVAAAAAFERGDRESAFSFLGNARALFSMSADALAGDIDEASVTQKRWEQTHDSASMRREALNLGSKSMANFGQNNAY